jgi:DNA-binding transcriptional regulator YiaG
VVAARIQYDAEIRHDGRLHAFTVSNLEIPVCRSCGERVFTADVDRQINDALRSHLVLLTPEQMRAALTRLEMTQKDLASRLGIAEATVSRWLSESQIQSKSLDTLLRIFFAFPMVRGALPVESRDPNLGACDITVAGNA